jgi:hypothetical protein
MTLLLTSRPPPHLSWKTTSFWTDTEGSEKIDSKVKTTGEAGGLSKPYKGIIQPRLKAHEKFANRN